MTWKEAPYHIHPDNPTFLVYTYNLIPTLFLGNYNRGSMNIVDNLYTSIIVPLIIHVITTHSMQYNSYLQTMHDHIHYTSATTLDLLALFQDRATIANTQL